MYVPSAFAVDDRDFVADLVSELTDRHEATRPEPWRVDNAPSAYLDRTRLAAAMTECLGTSDS